MARKLSNEPEFAGKEPAAAIAEKPQAVESVYGKKWLPLPLNDAGEPDTALLPEPKIIEKVRVRKLPDGTELASKERIYSKPGSARYSVNEFGEVIAWYKKRGGVGRKLVFQFKRQYKDDAAGRAKRKRDVDFRNFLRKQGIPGA